MCRGSFARKAGKDWSDDDVVEAFEEIMRGDKFVRFAFGRIRPACGADARGDALALELAKEVVATKLEDALFRYRHTYDPTRYRYHETRCAFCNWFYHLVARAAKEAAERERKKRRAIEEERKQQQQPRRSQPPPSDPAIEREQFWQRAQQYLDRLSPKYREAIVLFYKKGKSCAAAALIAKCSEGAFKVRLCRARQELRIIWQQEEEGGLS